MARAFVVISVMVVFLFAFAEPAIAQCALCKASAETSVGKGHNTAKGLNMGIMYLLIIPYALVAIIGYWWYTKTNRAGEDI